tara:strand:+ start:1421 stop:1834 length:414 start_codon:yes stop_codon:yes gene_type:complete
MFYLCNDILEMIGKKVQKIRDKKTLDYYLEIWNNKNPSRGWNSIVLNNITNEELNHCFLQIIGSNFIVNEDGSRISLQEAQRVIKLYDRLVLNSWYNFKSWMLEFYSPENIENDENILTFYKIKVIRDDNNIIIGIH